MRLTDEQRSLLGIALEIARDRFRDHAKTISRDIGLGSTHQLAVQFNKQADETMNLIDLFGSADEIDLTFTRE